MTGPTTGVFLAGLGIGIAASWIFEAVLVGRGVVSTYLAPIAIGAIVASAYLWKRKR